MIRNTETPVTVEVKDGNNIVQVKLAGLSTDSKPTQASRPEAPSWK